MAARHVKYLALCTADGKVLAGHTHWDKDAATSGDYEATLRKVLASPGWGAVRKAERRKLELRDAGSLYCLEIDPEGRVYAAVVTAAYPTRCVFSSGAVAVGGGPSGGVADAASGGRLMSEFAALVTLRFLHESLASPDKGLKRSLAPYLARLAGRFDDVEALDRILATERRAADVKAELAKTLLMADERSNLLDRQEAATAELATSAKQMFTTARKAARSQRAAMWRALCRPMGLCCCCLLVLMLIVGVGLAVNYTVVKFLPFTSAEPPPSPANATHAQAVAALGLPPGEALLDGGAGGALGQSLDRALRLLLQRRLRGADAVGAVSQPAAARVGDR